MRGSEVGTHGDKATKGRSDLATGRVPGEVGGAGGREGAGEGAPGRWFVRSEPGPGAPVRARQEEAAVAQVARVGESEDGHSAEKGQAAQRARLEWLRAGGTGEAKRAWTAATAPFNSPASAEVSSIGTDESE